MSGGTASGKTTLLNALIALIPDDERIVAIEDTLELRIDSPNCVRFEARGLQQGAVTIRDLVRHALRHRPDHIVVGEVRGGEAADLLQALNTGHGGSLTTVHANNADSALSRLASCANAGRRQATVATNWARSLRFLSTPLANASFRGDSQNVALLAAGVARGELQVARVILRIQPNPQQPHSATADFDLVRLEMENEVGRERWTLSLQFQFLTQIPTDLIAFNPMGIVITYLQGDRATVTGDQ